MEHEKEKLSSPSLYGSKVFQSCTFQRQKPEILVCTLSHRLFIESDRFNVGWRNRCVSTMRLQSRIPKCPSTGPTRFSANLVFCYWEAVAFLYVVNGHVGTFGVCAVAVQYQAGMELLQNRLGGHMASRWSAAALIGWCVNVFRWRKWVILPSWWPPST